MTERTLPGDEIFTQNSLLRQEILNRTPLSELLRLALLRASEQLIVAAGSADPGAYAAVTLICEHLLKISLILLTLS